jgi:hypothetical protein
MARLTQDKKDSILADFHTNKYSQRELSKKYKVALGTINNLTKEVNPLNEHLVNAQVTVLKGKSEISNEQMNAVMNTASDEARRLGLVYNASELLLKRSAALLENNLTVEKINVGDGMQSFDQRELNTSDLNNLSNAIDKASITLGINSRFSTAIQVNTPLEIDKSQQAPVITIIEDKHESRA